MKTLLRPPTVETAAFWQACREGRLLLQGCSRCGHVVYYPRLHCPRCGARELTAREAAGDGILYSFTQVHYSPFGDHWQDEVPYWVVQVDLAERVRMLSRLLPPASGRPRIGDAVRLTFVPVDDGMLLPAFQLAAESGSET
ncbi:MAG: Zn-ribbon domain-containing OB-fold protein [Lautropia sp.]